MKNSSDPASQQNNWTKNYHGYYNTQEFYPSNPCQFMDKSLVELLCMQCVCVYECVCTYVCISAFNASVPFINISTFKFISKGWGSLNTQKRHTDLPGTVMFMPSLIQRVINTITNYTHLVYTYIHILLEKKKKQKTKISEAIGVLSFLSLCAIITFAELNCHSSMTVVQTPVHKSQDQHLQTLNRTAVRHKDYPGKL